VGYFLLTGRPPFDRETTLGTLAAVLTQAPEGIRQVRPELPVDLEQIILRCLAKDPANRFHSIDALDAALAQCACVGWSHARAEEWWQQQRASLSDRGVDAMS
jgi:serine/threonine-protein kinase